MLANTIGFLHILVAIWLCLGAVACIFISRLRFVHWLSITATVILRFVFGGACPLTLWHRAAENPAIPGLSIDLPNTWFGLHLTNPQTSVALWLIFFCSSALLILESMNQRTNECLGAQFGDR